MRRAYRLAIACGLTLIVASAPARTVSPQARPPGPCDASECRQFDFWVDDWDVHTPDGKLAGTNLIEKILDGCVLQASRVGARGMRGRSFNMYSAGDRRWHQTWVDSQGSLLELAGGLKDGRMVLAGDTPQAGGNR
jgi:hypothetical protein